MTVEPASEAAIAHVWEAWGGFVVSVRRSHRPADVEGLLARDGERTTGLVTWVAGGAEAEVVTLDAFPPGQGTGALLLDAAEDRLRRRGVERVWLLTTEDNLRAVRFYRRQGYRLVAVHRDAMDRVRAEKPFLGRAGQDGGPLRDLWELEKLLVPRADP